MEQARFTDSELLEVFIESVEELLQSDFLSQIRTSGTATNFSWSNTTGFLGERTGPRKDAVKAFLLTLRFFMQNNEPTSLRRMEERINGLEIDPELKSRFRESRHKFNSYLDSAPSVRFPQGSGADSRRGILESLLYGLFAHANTEKRRRVKQ